jgi:hypothetical protein
MLLSSGRPLQWVARPMGLGPGPPPQWAKRALEVWLAIILAAGLIAHLS